MSPGQTGHITGQMGRVPGTDGTRTPGGVPPKFFMFIGFFLSLRARKTPVAGRRVRKNSFRIISGALPERDIQEPLNAPFLNGLFYSGFSRGKTAP